MGQNVGYNTIFPKQCPTVFIVKNIAPRGKRVRVFQQPILNGETRDLMETDFISEADIRHSLLKGELNVKLRHKELIVVDSNIDLLQFDPCHKEFLESVGIVDGLAATGTGTSRAFLHKVGVGLLGVKDGSNRTFTTPDIFINENRSGDLLTISIFHDGNRLVEDDEYVLAESGGAGTGFDTVIITAFKPKSKSTLIANYFTDIP